MVDKQCRICKQVLPPTEFHRNRKRKDGLRSKCKMCACASSRTWREENPERRRLQTKRQNLRYSKTHRGRAAAVAGTANYRAKKYGCVGRLTLQNVLDLWAYYGDICLDCKAPDTRELDHVKPLSLGGANFPANLQNVCHDCNLARWQSYVS